MGAADPDAMFLRFNHPRTRTYNETMSAVLERDLDPDERKRPIKGTIHMVYVLSRLTYLEDT